MNREKFIIEKGNALFYGIMFLFVCITITICFCLRNRDIEQVRLFLLCLNIFSLSIMIPYRIYLVFDKEYMNSVYADVRKAYLFELPFFPCNTAEILFSVAIFFNLKTLIAYCFFLGLLGPVAAFMVPAAGFEKESLLKVRMLGFYSTHYLTLMNIPIMLFTGYYVPSYSDVPKAVLIYAFIAMIMYFVNIYIDRMDLGYNANYFFVMDPNYHPIMKKVYNVIPYRYLFMVPFMIFVGIIFIALTFIIHIIF